jgi:hypothetical protein
MATEKIVSPGVFTVEKDLSFLPQGIANIGAAFIGPTIKGPALVPTMVSSYGEFEQIFGSTDPNLYLPYAAKEYLQNNGTLTVIRTLHDNGYTMNTPLALVATGSFGKKHIGLLHPSQVVSDTTGFYDGTTVGLFKSYRLTNPLSTSSSFAFEAITNHNDYSGSLRPSAQWQNNLSGSFVLRLSGSYTVDTSTYTNAIDYTTGLAAYSCSLSATSDNYLSKIFALNPKTSVDPAYLYTFFGNAASASLAADPSMYMITEEAGSNKFSFSTYSEAITPWIISQTVNAQNFTLFKVHTHSDGLNSNWQFKVAISQIKPAGSVPGSEYGSFTLTLRAVDQTKLAAKGSPFTTIDSDNRPNIIEVFDGVNLDPDSPNYIARRIGDRYLSFDGSKVIVNGNYPNKSKHIYVEMDESVDKKATSVQLVPFGFQAIVSPLPTGFTQPVSASYVSAQTINGLYNKRKHYGFDFDFSNTDNMNYLCALPIEANQTTGNNADFLLSNYTQNASAPGGAVTIGLTSTTSVDSRKFVVPFQGGQDGIYPNRRVLVGTDIVAGNTQGYDLSSINAEGYSVYADALNVISNQDEYDINMIVMPGVIDQYHSAVVAKADDVCNDRGDAFLIFDAAGITANIATATTQAGNYDSNYAATYYPWVKIFDANINKPVWVPPSVVLPGVLAFNDRVAAEWYAPAGLNRGGLSMVLEAYTRLTHAERDDLYEGRVNPIATFPGQGVVVWGQKTLQAKPSALDRINVRRLLIAVKKYIASATKYLVFEQNTAATRNRFLNIVNPYLESIQQRQGLYGFRVVMDETNNTPDLIDRNIMYGQIYLQPAKTAEFIIIDFNILPTGAAFPGA